ncbi:MAG: hypothetical protein ACFE9Z_14670 [Promethearchaeota archaeon]
MPRAIILYEIDESFGPNILAEYYLKQDDKIPQIILKEFAEKHDLKQLLDVTIHKDENRYFSKKMNAEPIEKDNLYLSFILKEEEDLVSLRSIFENVDEKIIQNFSSDKNKLTQLLKDVSNSILSLMQKLQEPKIIKETINERTKNMLDEGNLSEARELIDLGEDIPEKLAEEVKLAEDFLNEALYRKAKKSFLKAAEFAKQIQEDEIASFLENKGNQVGLFPDYLKERENLYKEIEKLMSSLRVNDISFYDNFIEPLDRLIEISLIFEDHDVMNILNQIKNKVQKASRLANELNEIDEDMKLLIKKI